MKELSYLCQGVCESHCEEEVCVGTASVDPQVPQHGAKDGGHQEHAQHHQGVPQVWKQTERGV